MLTDFRADPGSEAQTQDGLPLGQRVVLVLRYYEDLSVLQTAEVLGCSLSAVKSLANRGMRALRVTLGELDGF